MAITRAQQAKQMLQDGGIGLKPSTGWINEGYKAATSKSVKSWWLVMLTLHHLKVMVLMIIPEIKQQRTTENIEKQLKQEKRFILRYED